MVGAVLESIEDRSASWKKVVTMSDGGGSGQDLRLSLFTCPGISLQVVSGLKAR